MLLSNLTAFQAERFSAHTDMLAMLLGNDLVKATAGRISMLAASAGSEISFFVQMKLMQLVPRGMSHSQEVKGKFSELC